MPANISLTPAAAKFIGRILRFSGHGASAGLRLRVSPGGCSGYSADFSAEATPATQEQALSIDGVRLFLGPDSLALLQGMTIDFIETATQSGLSFTDPNRPACACSSADSAGPASITRIEVGAIGRRTGPPVLAR